MLFDRQCIFAHLWQSMALSRPKTLLPFPCTTYDSARQCMGYYGLQKPASYLDPALGLIYGRGGNPREPYTDWIQELWRSFHWFIVWEWDGFHCEHYLENTSITTDLFANLVANYLAFLSNLLWFVYQKNRNCWLMYVTRKDTAMSKILRYTVLRLLSC